MIDRDSVKNLRGFLLRFHVDVFNNKSHQEIIREEISACEGREYIIELILKQGRALLAMEPFPWEWVCDLINVAFDDEDDARKNIKHILDLLETEARKQGKL
jgi:N-acetylglutamate synthase-like GNAT family acetyltransferase